MRECSTSAQSQCDLLFIDGARQLEVVGQVLGGAGLVGYVGAVWFGVLQVSQSCV